MTSEELLKDYILSKYRSILEFTKDIDMPYGTITSIFKRGINNSSITNIIKICNALNISVDELANGKIVSNINSNNNKNSDIRQLILFTRKQIEDVNNIELDGKPLSRDEMLFLLDAMEVSMDMIRKRRARRKENEQY